LNLKKINRNRNRIESKNRVVNYIISRKMGMDGNGKRISYFIYATISWCRRERRKINNNMDRQGGGRKRKENSMSEGRNKLEFIRFDI
jgi:hypothetical protein